MTSVSEGPAPSLLTLPPEIARLAASSAQAIAAAQTAEGAYPAADGFGAYAGYCWFRDGAFVADAMSAAGEVDSADRFFRWCARVVDLWSERIDEAVAASVSGRPLAADRMLPTRFRFDGTAGEDDWWDFQLDGYGTWLWALAQHVDRYDLDASPWREPAAQTVRYLLASWSRPCFDWWEEHDDRVHVSTLACIAAGLRAASESLLGEGELRDEAKGAASTIVEVIRTRGTADGHLAKWLEGADVDGSLAAAVAPLGILGPGDPLAAATVEAIESYLTVDGGTHRYLGDTFYGGGQWPILSCFLGLARLRMGDRDRALDLLAWACSTAGASGELPEQVEGHLIAPNLRRVWIERWGPSARPLYWSHAMVLRLATAIAGADA